MARHELDHRHAHGQAATALKDLARSVPWETVPVLGRFDPETGRLHWRTDLARRFEILPTSGDVAVRALAREAYAQKPARTGDGKDVKKGDARDAAIWLSVVDYYTATPRVCFISDNTRDFGDGCTYPPPMDTAIRGLEDRMTHLTSPDPLVDQFARPLDNSRGEASARLEMLLATPGRSQPCAPKQRSS